MKQLGSRSKKRMRNTLILAIVLLLLTLIVSAMRPLINTKLQSSETFTFKTLAIIAASSYDAILIAYNSIGVAFDNNDFSESFVPNIEIRVEEGSITKMASDLPKSAKEKYYSGELLYPDGVWRDIKYRFRGSSIRHWDPKKPSLRLKLSKDYPLNQLRHINLVNPEDRAMISNYFGEYLGDKLGVMTHITEFVRLFINQKYVGLYHYTTREDEEMIRANNRFPGPLFIGNDLSEVWDSNDFEVVSDQDVLNHINPIDLMVNAINSEKSADQFQDLWSIISMDKYARFNALLALVGGIHTDYSHNHLYYFDPTLGMLEPIVSDINGHGLLLYPTPLSRFFEPDKPYVEVPINGRNNPLLNVALRDPRFRYLRNQYLYDAITGEGSYEKQFEELNNIFEYIDSSVLSDKEKASIKETFVGWFRVPYSNTLYEDSKDVLFDWIKDRNAFLEKELNKVTVEVDYLKGLDFDKLLVRVEGNSAVVLDSSVISGETTPLAPDGSQLESTNLYVLYPGIKHSDVLWHRGKEIYNFDISAGVQIYEFELRGSTHSVKNNLLKAFSNAITKQDLLPVIREQIIGTAVASDYTSRDIHAWSIKQTNKGNITLGPGSVDISENMIISPKQILTVLPGTTLNLADNVSIVSYGRVNLRGSREQPIVIQSQSPNSRWGVFAIIGQESSGSILQFTDISGGSGDLIDNIKFSGMLSVHWSDNFFMSNSKIHDNLISDDTIHIVHSKFAINSSIFDSCFSDCIDLDYATGRISDSVIDGAGGDGIDLMRSKIVIEDSYINSALDKGISVGEMSEIDINNSQIEFSNIGIAVKDLSKAKITRSTITNNSYGLSLYKKNWRYGSPGSATIKLSVIDNNTIDADVQEGGSLLYDIKSYPKVVIGDGHIEKLEY